MKTKQLISFIQIDKRNLAQNSTNEGVYDLSNQLKITRNSIKKNTNKSILENMCIKLYKECQNIKNANKYYKDCISILEDMKEYPSIVNILENRLANDIIPYIIDLKAFKESLYKYNLSNDTIAILEDAILTNTICQRIINNTNMISKRFDLNKYIKENSHKSLNENVIKICSMIDTFNTPQYAKMNIVLEEISYLYQKNGIKYNKSKMVQLVTEYFLSNNKHITQEDKNNYKQILNDNCCINNKDLINVRYLFNENIDLSNNDNTNDNSYDIASVSDINNKINVVKDNPCITLFNLYKLSNDKTPNTFKLFYRKLINDNTISNILKEISNILEWIHQYALANELISVSDVNDLLKYLLDKIIKSNNINNLKSYLSILQNEISIINSMINNPDMFYNIEYAKVLDDNINILCNEIITRNKNNIENIVYTNINENTTISLYEFKIFKFENIITAAIKANNILKKKTNKFSNKIKNKAINVFNTFKNWINEDYNISNISKENILDCINDNGYFDHIISVYKIHTDVLYEVYQSFNEVCSYLNKLYKNTSIKFYYENILEDNMVGFHIIDNTHIVLSEEEKIEWNNTFTEIEQIAIGELYNIRDNINILENINFDKLNESFDIVSPYMSANDIVSIIKLSSYMEGVISYNSLNDLKESYKIYNPHDYSGMHSISHALNDWKILPTNMDTKTEAINILNEVFNYGIVLEGGPADNTTVKNIVDKTKNSINDIKNKISSNNNNTDKDKNDKIDKTKININTIKYAMEALSNKAKELGDKGTNVTRELDIYIEKFYKGIKGLYTNDNRESIIKNSIIPSFHQLMGRLIVIGGASGLGAILGGPAGALFGTIVTAFSTIAISKHTTEKQRRLMLDEIDIELQICERELNKADNNGQIKKARAILIRKKKLQREFARIKYHIGDSANLTSDEITSNGN